MKIEAAIFDLDGTLTDSEWVNWHAWRDTVADFGVTLTEEAYSRYSGKSRSEIAAEFIKEYCLKVPLEQLCKQKNDLAMRILTSADINCMPFAREGVQHLIRSGFKVAIATSSRRSSEIFERIKRAGLAEIFAVIVTGNDVKCGKPAPDVYLLAASRLGSPPASCVAFEDTETGVAAAKAAGMLCFAVPNRLTKNQDFSRADAVFDNLEKAARYATR